MTNLHFVELDFTSAMADKLEQKQFDVVASSMALHHAEDKAKLFAQIFEVLKPWT